MSYGQVINGGAQMRKGLTKGINDKLEGFSKEQDRRKMLCDSVKKSFPEQHLSDNNFLGVDVGQRGNKLVKPKLVKNV
tara:strand:+ start:1623 stop:1856 length:234 start_codon:yes stop_codon:yes gene_type:complete